MRIYKYLFFSIVLVMVACRNENSVPGNVISMARMPAIVAEVHIIDGDLANMSQAQDTLYKYGLGQYLMVFKKYHTDTAQFRKSYLWYTKHPLLLDSISNQVITILQKKNDSLAKIKIPALKPVQPPAANPHVPPVNTANAISAK